MVLVWGRYSSFSESGEGSTPAETLLEPEWQNRRDAGSEGGWEPGDFGFYAEDLNP